MSRRRNAGRGGTGSRRVLEGALIGPILGILLGLLTGHFLLALVPGVVLALLFGVLELLSR